MTDKVKDSEFQWVGVVRGFLISRYANEVKR